MADEFAKLRVNLVLLEVFARARKLRGKVAVLDFARKFTFRVQNKRLIARPAG
jgi:hypothetical protein